MKELGVEVVEESQDSDLAAQIKKNLNTMQEIELVYEYHSPAYPDLNAIFTSLSKNNKIKKLKIALCNVKA